jgi:hypothetical protein
LFVNSAHGWGMLQDVIVAPAPTGASTAANATTEAKREVIRISVTFQSD